MGRKRKKKIDKHFSHLLYILKLTEDDSLVRLVSGISAGGGCILLLVLDDDDSESKEREESLPHNRPIGKSPIPDTWNDMGGSAIGESDFLVTRDGARREDGAHEI